MVLHSRKPVTTINQSAVGAVQPPKEIRSLDLGKKNKTPKPNKSNFWRFPLRNLKK